MAFKPQPTIGGYNAWVLERLIEARGTSPAEVTAWVIDRWIEANRQFLSSEYGINREQFLRTSKVVKLPSKSR